jgi:hypothetical protein
MITDDKLNIFEQFWADQELPKYVREAENYRSNMAMGEDTFPYRKTFSDYVINVPRRQMEERSTLKELPWYKRIFERTPEPELTIQQFFAAVKHQTSQLSVVEERAAGYEAAMVAAKKMGQKALLEHLIDGLAAFRAESQLISFGYSTYLEEKTLILFAQKSPKGLRLDWISNFARTIPNTIIEKKSKLDDIGAFDNYVVLHYDPAKKAVLETQIEKDAKKDPILFGLIKGRRRLYIVGDWIDDLCDLQLDTIADTLGKSAIQTLPNKVSPADLAPKS